MFDKFSHYLKEKVTITDDDILKVKTASKEVRLQKGDYLLKEGQHWKFQAFVSRGLLRTFRTDDNGQAHIVRFAQEDWWAGDGESYLTGQPSIYNIDALEATEIVLWDKPVFDALIKEIPALHQMSELLMSRSLIATQKQVYMANSLGADEKYADFLKSYPQLAQRVPLHMIASYLGVTRETLSRARRQAVKR